MQAGSAGELGRRRGLEQLGFWRKLLEHPSYDAFWRDQAVDKMLAAQPLKVPVMLVHSLWDQEDIYGALAVYKAIEPKDTGNDKVFLVIGPVAPRPGDRRRQRARRGQVRQRHGALLPPGDPAAVPRPVPEGRRAEGRRRAGHGVRDGDERVAAAARVAGRLRERLHRRSRRRSISRAGLKLGFDAPAAGDAAFDEYVSDPAKPVPFRPPPHPADGLRGGQHLAAVARRRPARGLGPPGRRWRSSPTC